MSETARRLAVCLILLACSGCVAANGADQWATRYTKPGATSQEVLTDGTECVPEGTLALSFIPYVGAVLANRNADWKAHAACMAGKGWTVTP